MQSISRTQNTPPADGDGAALDGAVLRLVETLLALGRRRDFVDPFSAACVPLEVPPAQLHSLLWMRADGPLAMGDLARRIGVTEKTLTGIVDRMEAAGLAQRERDAEDRRVVKVLLTAKGADHALQAHEMACTRLRAFLSRLDTQDRADLFRILEKLTRAPEATRENA